MANAPEVVIVGAGLAGLCCARRLHREGRSFVLLEANEAVGGRIRTDCIEGFLLDRGFQVFLPSYPEAQAVLDYAALDLHSFYPGSFIRYQGEFYRLADLWRRPQALFHTLFNPAMTLGDKLRIARLRADVLSGSIQQLYARPEMSTRESLQKRGFSRAIIDHFFRPFFGGVFLESELQTSSRHFEFLFRMFSLAQASLPAGGMEAIPRQIASQLPPGSIRFGARVHSLTPGQVILESGERLTAQAVVLAVDGTTATSLLPAIPRPKTYAVWCLYYAASNPPVREPILVLNGENQGPINHLSVPSAACSSYAPAGQSLISVTVLDSAHTNADTIEPMVRQQLEAWYGPEVRQYRHLRNYYIENALPEQTSLQPQDPRHATRKAPGLYVCGDYCENASINGAMLSGRHAAEAILRDFTG